MQNIRVFYIFDIWVSFGPVFIYVIVIGFGQSVWKLWQQEKNIYLNRSKCFLQKSCFRIWIQELGILKFEFIFKGFDL